MSPYQAEQLTLEPVSEINNFILFKIFVWLAFDYRSLVCDLIYSILNAEYLSDNIYFPTVAV